MTLRRTLGASTLALLAGGCSLVGFGPRGSAPSRALELETQNVAPALELETLLRPADVEAAVPLRIAVVPAAVEARADDRRAAFAGALQFVLTAELARARGVSVVEVREALGRARAQASEDARSMGRELGAAIVVVPKITTLPEGVLRLAAEVVDVETGDRLASEAVEVRADDFGAIASFVEALAESAGWTLDEAEATAWSADRASALGRAAAPLRRGAIMVGLAALTEAFPEASDALVLEAEVVDALLASGLAKEAEQRARAALTKRAVEASRPCERAAVQTTLAAVAPRFDAAREAVAIAAACGDASKLVSALATYAERALRIDVPLAEEAIRRADGIVAAEGRVGAWARCELAAAQAQVFGVSLRREADDPEVWRRVVIQCDLAGHERVALKAVARSASLERSLSKSRTTIERSSERATRVLGEASAIELEMAEIALMHGDRAGAATHTDAAMRSALDALARARGGELDGPERALRSSLGGPSGTAPDARARAADLVARGAVVERALRARLGRAVELASTLAIVDDDRAALARLAAALLAETGVSSRADSLERALADAKLPRAELDGMGAAPLRASGHDVRAALDALASSLWRAVEGDEATFDRADADVLARLAAWSGSELDAVDAACAMAWVDAESDPEEARAALARARALAASRPSAKDRVERLVAALDRTASPERTLAAIDARIESVRTEDGVAWADAELSRAATLVRMGAANAELTVRLHEVAEGLASRGKPVDALRVLDGAVAVLAKRGSTSTRAPRSAAPPPFADGSLDAVRLHEARVRVSASLGDGLRTTRARADRLAAFAAFAERAYRGGKRNFLARDPAVRNEAETLATELRALADHGRVLESVAIVAGLDPALPGALGRIDDALRVLDREPAEDRTRGLLARLHAARAEAIESPAESRSAHAKARQLLIEQGELADAVAQAARAIVKCSTPEQALSELAACRTAAGSDPVRLRCALGLSEFSARTGHVAEPETARPVLAMGLAALAEASNTLARSDRIAALAQLLRLAFAARDEAATVRLVTEASELAVARAPDAYAWSEFLATAAEAASLVDAARALDFAKQFAATSGASDRWRAELYVVFARYASIAGDAAAEQSFVDAGRELARRNAPELVALYDLHAVRAAIRRREWNLVERIFREAARSNTIESPANRWWSMQLTLEQAMARAFSGDANGARTILEPIERAARLPGAFDESPALYTRALELLASTERTLGACPQAAQTTALAAEARARATERRCHGGWCETPDFAVWRAPNACRERLKPDPSLLFSW